MAEFEFAREDRYLGYPIFELQYSIDEMEDIASLRSLYHFVKDSVEYESLDGKTQVLNAAVENKGLAITTRMIHDMHVSQNAMKIANRLRLSTRDILLAQITGLAHDLGHTPFGHSGELALREEVEKFGKHCTFSHATYGADVFDSILNDFITRNNETGVFVPENIGSIGEYREEIREGIRNHSQYYGYKLQGETMPQKCVRLSDTLSFMVTDLSDLMRGQRNDGTPILFPERVLAEVRRLSPDERKFDELVESLKAGGGSLERIHVKVIEEAFSIGRGRSLEKAATVIDDYKLLQEIDNNFSVNRNENAFMLLTEYCTYLQNDDGIAIKNEEIFELIRENLGEISRESALAKMKELAERSKEVLAMRRNGEEVSLSAEDSEIISKVLLRTHENILEQKENIWKTEFLRCPTLMMLFEIQDKIQYREILTGDINALGNNEEQIKSEVSNRFQKVLKMAYAVYKDSGIYGIDVPGDIISVNGKQIPNAGNIEYPPLNYAIYTIQQMRNEELLAPNFIETIAERLGIPKDKIPEIEAIPIETIYQDYPEPEFSNDTTEEIIDEGTVGIDNETPESLDKKLELKSENTPLKYCAQDVVSMTEDSMNINTNTVRLFSIKIGENVKKYKAMSVEIDNKPSVGDKNER